MTQLLAVIGANWGDEGKGLITDFLVSTLPAEAVVRFNGGAQAGHTVVSPDGRRHVFHHFGSGSLAGARTYLSSHFIVNPIIYCRERKELEAIKALTGVFVDVDCAVTTPWDIMINQAAERARGADRHGSCGLGINETVVRSSWARFDLKVKDLVSRPAILRRLNTIAVEWAPKRLKELKAEAPEWLGSEEVAGKFADECEELVDTAKRFRPGDLKRHKAIVFEGAQGLGLDQSFMKGHPYLTRSNTGMRNVFDIAKRGSLNGKIEPVYVTRVYATRHGPGPLSGEKEATEYFPGLADRTNVDNPHQGPFRLGLINVDDLAARIERDRGRMAGAPTIALTCADHLGGRAVPYIAGGQLREAPLKEFATMLAGVLNAENVLVASGPTSVDIRWVVGK